MLRNSILNYLLMSCIWLSKAPIPPTFLGAGGGGGQESHPLPLPGREGVNIFQSLISRDFPSNFTCSICFFLLTSCFLFLHFKALQIILLTSSCGAGRREIRRFVGGSPYPSFASLSDFPKPVTAPLMQNGELQTLKPQWEESSTAVQSSQLVELKTVIFVHGKG